MLIFKKESEVADLVMQHVAATAACVEGAAAALNTYFADDPEATHDLEVEVGRQESEADRLMLEIRDLLYSGAYLPQIRSDIFRLVKAVDKVAGRAEGTAHFLDFQRPDIPEHLQPDFTRMFASTVACFGLLRRAFKTFFKPKDKFEKLRARSTAVARLETEIDDEEAALIRVIFSSDMELSRKLHLTQYVQLIGRISNAMENASDELMYAALKSRI